MQVSSAVHQILYLSQLTPGCTFDAFTSMCRAARCRHAQGETAGVLLFDGHRFGQLLQGPPHALLEMRQAIHNDLRHRNLVLLFDGVADPATLRRSFASGFCEPDELDVFDAPGGLRGDAAMAAFQAIVSRADLSP